MKDDMRVFRFQRTNILLTMMLLLAVQSVQADGQGAGGIRDGGGKGGSSGSTRTGTNKPSPSKARTVPLTIASAPGNCAIFVDGRERGVTDEQGTVTLSVPVGRRKVKVACEGYDPQERSLNLTQKQTEQFALSPRYFTLVILTSPPESEVYVDGEFKGVSHPGGDLPVTSVRYGTRSIKVHKRGYKVLEQTARVTAQGSSVRVVLAPDPVSQQVDAMDRLLNQDQLTGAFVIYAQLARDNPLHEELPEALNRLLTGLQNRSRALIARCGLYGLNLPADQVSEMYRLYRQAIDWRSSDSGLNALDAYWESRFYLNQAQQAVTESDRATQLQKMRAALTRLNASGLNVGALLYDVGWLYYRLSDRQMTERYFQAARQSEGNWAYPLYGLGLIYMNQAEQQTDKKSKRAIYAQAISYFTQAIKTDSQLSMAYAQLAISYVNSGKAKEALASAQQAVSVNPQSGYAYFALGYVQMQKGKSNYDASRSAFATALASKVDALDAAQRSQVNAWMAQMSNAKR